MKIKKKCDYCNKFIYVNKWRDEAYKHHYCSKKCRTKGLSLLSREKRVCKNCKEIYYKAKSIQENRKFCSKECYFEYAKKTHYKRKYNYKCCPICKNKYYPYYEKQIFCSRKCQLKFQGKGTLNVFHNRKKFIEQTIKRKLRKGEIIHHLDGNRKNNKKSNLIVLKNKSKHSKLHIKAYNYVVEKGIDDYLKWFDKKYELEGIK